MKVIWKSGSSRVELVLVLCRLMVAVEVLPMFVLRHSRVLRRIGRSRAVLTPSGTSNVYLQYKSR